MATTPRKPVKKIAMSPRTIGMSEVGNRMAKLGGLGGPKTGGAGQKMASPVITARTGGIMPPATKPKRGSNLGTARPLRGQRMK